MALDLKNKRTGRLTCAVGILTAETLRDVILSVLAERQETPGKERKGDGFIHIDLWAVAS